MRDKPHLGHVTIGVNLNRTTATVAVAAAAAIIAGCGSTSKPSNGAAGGAAASATNAGSATNGAAASGSAATATGTALAAKANPKLGTILAAGPRHMTAYLFTADASGKPTCSGACASVWPPVPAGSGAAAVSGGLEAAKVGAVKRADGTSQLTYAGHPLYYFAQDGDKGDAYGQGVNGFGAPWYAVTPAGEAAKSKPSSAGASSSAGTETTSSAGKGYAY
jgi:predicted lipoprotein with Yx(FWY)xxD motif